LEPVQKTNQLIPMNLIRINANSRQITEINFY
jgi:hypothetical protein